MTIDVQRLRELMNDATPGKWSWATSCSFRRMMAERVTADGHRQTRYVAEAYEASDGMLDIAITPQDMALIVAMHESLPALLDRLQALEGEVGGITPAAP